MLLYIEVVVSNSHFVISFQAVVCVEGDAFGVQRPEVVPFLEEEEEEEVAWNEI